MTEGELLTSTRRSLKNSLRSKVSWMSSFLSFGTKVRKGRTLLGWSDNPVDDSTNVSTLAYHSSLQTASYTKLDGVRKCTK